MRREIHMMQFWLLIMTTGTAVHVGNFPDMASCMAAARANQTVMTHQVNPTEFTVGLMCIQANTGKPNDPPAPS
jgi:hypothetical protein